MVYVNVLEYSRYDISINGNVVDNIIIPEIVENDIVEFKLIDIKSGDTIIKDLKANCMFKY